MMTESQAPLVEFNFPSGCSSPYVSAPSSPQRFFGGNTSNSYFYSAPASPARISASSANFSQFHHVEDDSSDQYTSDFAFDFSGHLEPPQSLSADELFHGGVIKPLQVTAALQPQRERGRSTMVSPKKNASSLQQHKKSSSSRSLSPSTLRVSDLLLDGSKEESSSTTWYNKLSLMFRSKSEGSAASNKNKWAALKRRSSESSDVKNMSMRRKGMSSHEWHYTVNRAASEEMRKKTLLPYKQHGWLGCLGFSPVNFDASLLTPHHNHSSY